MFKCKICGRTYTDLSGMYSHIENKHKELVPKNMSIPQYYYFMKTGKTNGNCVMCKQPTTWNKNTNKYNRFCTNPACKEKYAAEFKKRMIAKYGKVHLLNDPAKQREMLANRKISGRYRWSDGTESVYTGSFELDFVKLLDLFMDWDPVDVSMPSPHTYTYMYEGEERYYIPDAFIHSLDLEIEIKDGGDNPNMHHKIRDVDKVKEKLKDEVLMSQKSFHYIKITNKNYTNFFDFLKKAKEGFAKYEDEKKMPRIFLIEDIKTKSANPKTLYEATVIDDVNEEIVVEIHNSDNISDELLEFAKELEVDELITESVSENLSKTIKDLSKLSVFDLEELVMINFNAKKNNPEAVEKYIKKLIKASRTENDMLLVRNIMRMYVTHTEKLSKEDPTKKALEREYKTWVFKEYQPEYDKKWKKITESFDYIQYQRDDEVLEEGLNIPIPKMVKNVINKKLDNFANMSDEDIDKVEADKIKKENIRTCRDLVRAIGRMMKAVKTIRAVKFVLDLIKYTFIFFKAQKIANLITDDKAFNAELGKFAKRFGIPPEKVMWDFDDDNAITETTDIDKSHVEDNLYHLKEGAISYTKLNSLLGSNDHKRLAKYMDDYESFYRDKLKEDPTKSKNINTEVNKARKYIEDLGRTGNVNNELVKYAIKRIDHSGLCVEPIRESAGNIVNLSVVVGADTKRKSFGLTDYDSKVFINNNYSIRRPNTINSMNCVMYPDNLEDTIQGKRVFKYKVKLNNDTVDLGDMIDRFSTDTISIPGLFNLNEAKDCKFIKNICSELGLNNCEIELVSDNIY